MQKVPSSEQARIIKSELSKLQGAKVNETYSMIRCPYHNDNNPSGRVNHNVNSKTLGGFKCYSCGVGSEEAIKWNELAARLGLAQIGDGIVNYIPKVNDLSVKASRDALFPDEDAEAHGGPVLTPEQYDLFEFPGQFKDGWREVPIALLERIGAKYAYVDPKEGDVGRFYVWLPIYIHRELCGYIKAQIKKPHTKEIPSYINAGGTWSLTHGLFPFDYAMSVAKRKKVRTVVLVEGPRDALRLLRYGIPAMAIMGTHSWTDEKRSLLELEGIERIILMFDGDEAGAKATALVRKSCKRAFEVKNVNLSKYPPPRGEDKNDPGNCSPSIVKMVQRNLR